VIRSEIPNEKAEDLRFNCREKEECGFEEIRRSEKDAESE
jgi:hypothetical protein